MDMETAQVGPNRCGSGSAAVAMVATNSRGRFWLLFLVLSLVLPDVVDNSGATTPFAHSWLRLLVSDLQRLNNVLQLGDLDDAVACPAKLFTDVEVKETFLYADVHVLVAEWSTERVPPPNAPRDEQVLPPPVEGDIELPFVCEQTLQDGTLCSAAFPTKIALAAHQNPLQETCTRSQTLRCICLGMW